MKIILIITLENLTSLKSGRVIIKLLIIVLSKKIGYKEPRSSD